MKTRHTGTETHDYVTPTQQLCVEEHEQTSVIQNNRLSSSDCGQREENPSYSERHEVDVTQSFRLKSCFLLSSISRCRSGSFFSFGCLCAHRPHTNVNP